MTSANLEETLEYLISKKAYGMKISQSIIYLNEYFYVFLFPEKHYTSVETNTTNTRIFL